MCPCNKKNHRLLYVKIIGSHNVKSKLPHRDPQKENAGLQSSKGANPKDANLYFPFFVFHFFDIKP